jgi:hypothetical protein
MHENEAVQTEAEEWQDDPVTCAVVNWLEGYHVGAPWEHYHTCVQPDEALGHEKYCC